MHPDLIDTPMVAKESIEGRSMRTRLNSGHEVGLPSVVEFRLLAGVKSIIREFDSAYPLKRGGWVRTYSGCWQPSPGVPRMRLFLRLEYATLYAQLSLIRFVILGL